jgi:hypothetical protein
MRRWILVGAAGVLLIGGLSGFGIWHRARFEATVEPRVTPSVAKCQSILLGQSFPNAALGERCRRAVHFPWFHIDIRNSGHAPGFAYCWAHAYDRSGVTVLRVAIPVGSLGPGLPLLSPGQSVTGDWYFEEIPSGPIDHYTAGCWRSATAGPP